MNPLSEQQSVTIVQQAQNQATADLFASARNVGLCAGALTLGAFGFLNTLGPVLALLAFVAWIAAGALLADAREARYGPRKVDASSVWREINYLDPFAENVTSQERELFAHIERIYERDPHGKILPLPQAVQLIFAWRQQQNRLQSIEAHIERLTAARTALQEKQTRLRELSDEDTEIESALVPLNRDIAALVANYKALRASCSRLEDLLDDVDDAIGRRKLHQDVGEITAGLSAGKEEIQSARLPDDYFDLEHQITREVETYLQLERETDAQLRDL